MTYREMCFGDDLNVQSQAMEQQEKSVFQSILSNQGPVMKFWFGIMLLNLVLFLFIIR